MGCGHESQSLCNILATDLFNGEGRKNIVKSKDGNMNKLLFGHFFNEFRIFVSLKIISILKNGEKMLNSPNRRRNI